MRSLTSYLAPILAVALHGTLAAQAVSLVGTDGSVDWNRFYTDFIDELSKLLEANAEYRSSPTWDPSEEDALLAQFDSEEWNQRR